MASLVIYLLKIKKAGSSASTTWLHVSELHVMPEGFESNVQKQVVKTGLGESMSNSVVFSVEILCPCKRC